MNIGFPSSLARLGQAFEAERQACLALEENMVLDVLLAIDGFLTAEEIKKFIIEDSGQEEQRQKLYYLNVAAAMDRLEDQGFLDYGGEKSSINYDKQVVSKPTFALKPSRRADAMARLEAASRSAVTRAPELGL